MLKIKSVEEVHEAKTFLSQHFYFFATMALDCAKLFQMALKLLCFFKKRSQKFPALVAHLRCRNNLIRVSNRI